MVGILLNLLSGPQMQQYKRNMKHQSTANTYISHRFFFSSEVYDFQQIHSCFYDQNHS